MPTPLVLFRWLHVAMSTTLFVLTASIFLPAPAAAAVYDCSYKCMRVFDVDIADGEGTARQRLYEAIDHSDRLNLPDDAPESERINNAGECSARPCLLHCRAQCGGRYVEERAPRTLGHGEQACLNTIPPYVLSDNALCIARYSDRCNPARRRLIDLEFARLYGGVLAPFCERRATDMAPPPSSGAESPPVRAQACTEPATTRPSSDATDAPLGQCRYTCIRPGEERVNEIIRVRGTTSERPGGGGSETRTTASGGSDALRCREATLETRTGSSCAPGSRCSCEEQCIRECGSDSRGKTHCFLGTDDTRQATGFCPGAVTNGHAPRCEIAGTSRTLENPLNTTDIGEFIARFIRAVTGIAGSLALLMFVVGGVIWMTAEGSDRVQLAQTILKNASLGLILIFLAYSLVSLFLAVLGV